DGPADGGADGGSVRGDVRALPRGAVPPVRRAGDARARDRELLPVPLDGGVVADHIPINPSRRHSGTKSGGAGWGLSSCPLYPRANGGGPGRSSESATKPASPRQRFSRSATGVVPACSRKAVL